MPKSTAQYSGIPVLELHEDVARVHVGVEEVVPQHLREEIVTPFSARRWMLVPRRRSSSSR